MTDKLTSSSPEPLSPEQRNFSRGLGLFDSVMLVVGAMIGSDHRRGCCRLRPLLWRAVPNDFRGTLSSPADSHLESLCDFSLDRAIAGHRRKAFLTLSNTLGLRYGELIQSVFTVAKTGALSALILLGILVGRNSAALHANFSHPWHTPGLDSPVGIALPGTEQAERSAKS